MDGRTQYGNFKVKKETAFILQEAKRAVQALVGGREMTNDEFVLKLVEMAQAGDVAFNKVYKKVIKDSRDLLKLAEEEIKKADYCNTKMKAGMSDVNHIEK